MHPNALIFLKPDGDEYTAVYSNGSLLSRLDKQDSCYLDEEYQEAFELMKAVDLDPVMQHHGECWQYMGSEKKRDRWYHCMRHRMHPDNEDARAYLYITALKLNDIDPADVTQLSQVPQALELEPFQTAYESSEALANAFFRVLQGHERNVDTEHFLTTVGKLLELGQQDRQHLNNACLLLDRALISTQDACDELARTRRMTNGPVQDAERVLKERLDELESALAFMDRAFTYARGEKIPEEDGPCP